MANTIADILSNAFDRDYTTDRAMADLERLMNEATLAEILHGTDSKQHRELRRLVPIQERLAKAKLEGDPLFDRLGTLEVTPHGDD